MAQAKMTRAEFIEAFEQYGGRDMARRTGVSIRAIMSRRERIEKEIGRQLTSPHKRPNSTRFAIEHPHRQYLEVKDGVVLIGSDAHYWPNIITTAHRAFVHFCKELQPKAVILNGDVLDGATISRHPPISWEDRPQLVDEIEACKERLNEIERAAPNAKRIWTLGNHDGRFETRLATVAPEYAKVHGMHLKDNFPYWFPAWSCWINGSVVVKHRLKGGVHATHNNTVTAGLSMFTGHLHSLKVTPYTDYNGTRFGVDTGTLAGGPQGPQFLAYLEDAPANWRPGFAVATFHKGRLLWPEVVHVIGDDEVEFRGRVIRV
jgi:hypothetical protein